MDLRKVLGVIRRLNFQVPTDARRYSSLQPTSPLREVRALRSNPGNLRMLAYVPPAMADPRALLVVLHGCGQTAAGYDHGAGWSTLADRYGFALLFPEQQVSNNPKACFNWFERADTQRGYGEVASIREMVKKMVLDHRINPDCVFVTGLSAGGAMTSAMLACYPEVFAAGAIIAGLPYGTAHSVQQAFRSMFQCPSRTPREWGDLVRQASPRHNGPWPRVSVWHGNADKTVVPANAREIVKQWTDLHGLAAAPSMRSQVDGYPREVWLNEAGDEVIESYTITHMPHGTPLATAAGESACGVAGPFLLEAGISSSFHIAKFFGLSGLDERVARPWPQNDPIVAREAVGEVGHPSRILHHEALKLEPASEAEFATIPAKFDIGAIITKALTAAGLMKK